MNELQFRQIIREEIEMAFAKKEATAGTMAETVNVEEYFKEREEFTSRIQKRV